MNNSKKEQSKTYQSKNSGKIQFAIQKAQAIQQRQLLRQMIVNKFIKNYGKNNKNIISIIQVLVSKFFLTEKITQDSLKSLKASVIDAIKNPNYQNRNSIIDLENNISVNQKKSLKDGCQENIKESQFLIEKKSLKSHASQKSFHPKHDDQSSDLSSLAQKSVYVVEGDEQDQWAALVKFDTQLFKKQKELEKLREEQFKNKMKIQLDKQVQQKLKKKQIQKNDQHSYFLLQKKQLQNYDNKQNEKKNQYETKIMLQKQMRDKQIKDQKKRKKQQHKKYQQLDTKFVQKIKEEIKTQEQELAQRKQLEREKFRKVITENSLNQIKLKEQAQRQRLEDIRIQNQYLRLQKELQDKKEQEKRQRQDKIKKLIPSFTENAVNNQKQHFRSSDSKMLVHIENQIRKDKQQQQNRKRKLQEQKRQMRQYLSKQVQEKKLKEIQENQINRLQATIWKEDLQNFKDHENKKSKYIDEINKKHQEILLAQISQKDLKKNRKKMNNLELLYNKTLMKEVAQINNNVVKANIQI